MGVQLQVSNNRVKGTDGSFGLKRASGLREK
jgi:hypothetical protein